MLQQVAGALGAPGGELGRLGLQGRVLGGVVRAGLDAEVRVVVVDAVDVRLREAGAARVETDDVERVEQALAVDEVGLRGEVGAAVAGAAGVHEQYADARRGLERTVAHDVDLDLLPVGVGVVERHGDAGLVDAGVDLGPLDLARRGGVDHRRRGGLGRGCLGGGRCLGGGGRLGRGRCLGRGGHLGGDGHARVGRRHHQRLRARGRAQSHHRDEGDPGHAGGTDGDTG